MTNKEAYAEFCASTYVPIYSKPWWMDAVCGPENWDVWLYDNGEQVFAAMPYYMETRGKYKYITKAPLTQTNGIIFREDARRGAVKEAELQNRVIDAACDYIESLGLDVYEQQYSHTFQNWSPFFWRNYTNVLRYSYIIADTSDMDRVWEGVSPTYRNEIRKGRRLTHVDTNVDPDTFYDEHAKVFLKQGIQWQFGKDFWFRLYEACRARDAGQMFVARDGAENIHAVLYLVWDERYAYQYLGGYIPEFASSQAYPALTYHGIEVAHEKSLAYDFEGSMLKGVAKAFRRFGGVPMPYYRIRKVFNPEIVRAEAEDYIRKLQSEPSGNKE